MEDIDRRAVLLIGPLLLLLTVLVATAASSSLPAGGGVPQVIHYQGVMTAASGEPATGTFTMTFQLYDAAEGGSALWGETQPVTVTHGLFGAHLGHTSPLAEIPFDGRELYLAVSVNGGSEMSPRMRVAAVPYAFAAERALSAPLVSGRALPGDGAGAGWGARGSVSTPDQAGSSAAGGIDSVVYHIPWSVLTTGGGDMASSNYRMGSTLAQPLAGAAKSAFFQVRAGYWPGARTLTERRAWLYLPLVLRGW